MSNIHNKLMFAFVALILFTYCSETKEYVKPEEMVEEHKKGSKEEKHSKSGAKHDAHHWTYEDIKEWNHIEGATCSGGNQSPIDISTSAGYEKSSNRVDVTYRTVKGEILDNGHTIQVNAKGDYVMNFGGNTYRLLQFHFHHKSEHTINGAHRPMEVHFVHKNTTNDSLAVIGVMLEEGATNSVIEELWASIPKEKSKAKMLANEFDIRKMMPVKFDFYNYAGSLTTPPCSEIVNWIVLKNPITMSKEQIEKFSSMYENNARPTLPLGNRKIKKS